MQESPVAIPLKKRYTLLDNVWWDSVQARIEAVVRSVAQDRTGKVKSDTTSVIGHSLVKSTQEILWLQTALQEGELLP